jgi:hypothetical protein
MKKSIRKNLNEKASIGNVSMAVALSCWRIAILDLNFNEEISTHVQPSKFRVGSMLSIGRFQSLIRPLLKTLGIDKKASTFFNQTVL